ncbi:MAG: cytochrome c1 [Pseudolabrys sp.]|nr:cytochrome c1 [Pseudolabrys sp.]
MKTVRTLALAALLLSPSLAYAADEHSHEAPQPPRLKWSFAGPFGKFDQAQLQRGFKIYKEVCSACHSMEMLAFRNLADAGGPGYSPAQAAAIASEYKIKDGPNDAGEMFEREGRVADYFPKPFANEQAGRAANGGAYPPDLTVMAKARTYERGFPWFVLDMVTQYQEHGVDYIAALLKGYAEKPKDMQMPAGMNYNTMFPGHMIGMPPPLQNGQVTFDDGAPATLDQYAQDVAAFLMWTAEPNLVARKRLGLQVMIFLLVLAGLLYFTKKKVWHDVHAHPEKLKDRA